MGGIGFKTANSKGINENDGTIIKPGASGGLNVRLRLSPKSSLQLTGSLVLDRHTILGYVDWRFYLFNPGSPDTIYSERYYGDLELEQLFWQGTLSYRYTLNYRWGASLGVRYEGLLNESGSYRRTNVKQYRRVGGESTLIQDIDLDMATEWYFLDSEFDGGLQANVYCQLNRRLQLVASFDTPMPFAGYDYRYNRYKLLLEHRLF
jgi:hypothetical protein